MRDAVAAEEAEEAEAGRASVLVVFGGGGPWPGSRFVGVRPNMGVKESEARPSEPRAVGKL